MNPQKSLILPLCLLLLFISSCTPRLSKEGTKNKPAPAPAKIASLKTNLIIKYQNEQPRLWGEKIPGVLTRLNTKEKVIALTFDACGGPHGSGYDVRLINFLIKEQVPATLFINARWIDANNAVFMALAKNPLFEIENHGFRHLPLSVNGRSVYGIKGTAGVSEVSDEILLNQRRIEKLTGRKPLFFRSGTAYYDDVALKISREMGVKIAGYNVLGDAGATYTAEQVKKACLNATPGSIILLHMNHPEKHTAEGIIKAVPELRRQGFSFVKLASQQKNRGAEGSPTK